MPQPPKTDTQMTQEKTEELSPELLHDLRILGEKYYGNQLYSEHITYQHELQSLIQKHLQQREQAAEHRGYAKGYVEGSNTGVDNVRNSLLYHCAESRRKTINYSVVDRILGEMIHTPTPKEGDVAG